jgi:1,4-dihydroxy-2-naphthoate octaprenyltransferase
MLLLFFLNDWGFFSDSFLAISHRGFPMTPISMWWRAVRPFSFTVSVIPPILGATIALLENPNLHFKWGHFFLTLIGCVMAHAGANLLSDYFDYKMGVDREGTFGSSGLLVEKVMRPKQILRGAWMALIMAGVIGVYLVLSTPKGMLLIWLMLLGAIFAVFYTARPIAFKYRAVGDVAVFISFGPAMVLGAYYVQAHHFSWGPVLYALPVAVLVDAILHSNNLRDMENDRKVNIRTIPIVIGETGARFMYYGLIFGAYLLTLILITWAGLSVISLLTFLSLPLAIKLAQLVHRKDRVPGSKFATIDAATAQLHMIFGVLMITSLFFHHLVLN